MIVETLTELWLWDVEQLRNPWLYYPLCFPALFFVAFMLIKWMVLTIPLWMPIQMIVNAFKVKTTTTKKQSGDSETFVKNADLN